MKNSFVEIVKIERDCFAALAMTRFFGIEAGVQNFELLRKSSISLIAVIIGRFANRPCRQLGYDIGDYFRAAGFGGLFYLAFCPVIAERGSEKQKAATSRKQKQKPGTGNREPRTGNREPGTENRKQKQRQGTGNRKQKQRQGTGNWEPETKAKAKANPP